MSYPLPITSLCRGCAAPSSISSGSSLMDVAPACSTNEDSMLVIPSSSASADVSYQTEYTDTAQQIVYHLSTERSSGKVTPGSKIRVICHGQQRACDGVTSFFILQHLSHHPFLVNLSFDTLYSYLAYLVCYITVENTTRSI